MARVRYDVTGVDASGSFEAPTPGIYKAKIIECTVAKPEGKDRRIEVVYEIIGHKKYKGARIYDYINLESDAASFRLAQFIQALGLKEKGSLDTSKLVDEEVNLKVKNETFNEERRAKAAFVFSTDEDAPGDDDDDDDLDDDDDDDDDDNGAEGADGSSDDDDDDDEDEPYEEWELSSKGNKKALIARLEKDDDEQEDDDDDEDVDYESLSLQELKEQCEERGLKATGRKSILVKRLEKADEDSDEPF